jgi:DNA processing protein
LKRRNHYRALLALQRISDLGLRRIKLLLDKSGVDNASDLFRLKMRDFLRIDGIGETVAKNITAFKGWDEADAILDKTEKLGAGLVAIDDEDYPGYLRHIYDPPVLLWIKGDRNVLDKDGVAIIGTRRPSVYGMEQAEQWAIKLSEAGLCINSGLAYGVDTIAHKSTLKAGGKTVAVLGSGIDVIYPAKNKPIADRIIENNGAVITEYPPGTAPDAVNFPGRNRIVSGMSRGVLVIESGIKGGSMITARYALDQNREVFVIPHPLNYARGKGCNYLIKTGQGKLVQNPADIYEEISIHSEVNAKQTVSAASKKWESLELGQQGKDICLLLAGGDLHIDQLCEQTGKPTYQLLPLLLELEMLGAVRQKAGKYFGLC